MSTPELDRDNIQGDLLSGLPKKKEYFIFFEIVDATKFRQDLVHLVPSITTVTETQKQRKTIGDHKKKRIPGLITLVGVNISFSHKGFVKLGIDDSSLATAKDPPFLIGQKQDAVDNLGDPRKSDNKTPDWDEHFLQDIHGVILITGDSISTIEKKKAEIDLVFRANTPSSSIKEVITVKGDGREGSVSAHEHFGFLDGVSNPAIKGFTSPIHPGPSPVDPGVILTGHKGDPDEKERASWVVDGSFLVFRWLFQLVPEFNNFLKEHPILEDGHGNKLTPEEGSELLGARMVGRWKSGAPIDITPFEDKSGIGTDPTKNDDFRFEGQISSQFRCPFAAHVRKTNPRDDLEVPPDGIPSISVQPNRIMRHGIQFGEELTAAEIESTSTQSGRGLLFACYQSSITNGFQFHQQSWANNKDFPIFTGKQYPAGLDPIIGQGKRLMTGLDPNKEEAELEIPTFVIPKGGEYFFSPSLDALKNTIAKA